MSTYLGFDVLDIASPSRENDVDVNYQRRFQLLDNETGKRKSDSHAAAPNPVRPALLVAFSRTQAATYRTFLDARKGKAVPFWLPSYQQDMTLAADLSSGSAAPTIKRFGYGTLMFPAGGSRRHLAFLLPGTAFDFRKVTGAVDPGSGATESITLSGGVSRTYPAATSIVMFLTLCRLEQDEYEIQWYGGQGVAKFPLQLREIPNEAPT